MSIMIFSTDILIVILSGSILILAIILAHTIMRLRRLLVGRDNHDLEDSLVAIIKRTKDLETFRSESEKYLTNVERRLRNSTRAVETVRFNAFGGGANGGNQSFASAFLSEEGDGVVISSIYSRDRVSIFAKPVKAFDSRYEISDEEQQAIDGAKAKMSSD